MGQCDGDGERTETLSRGADEGASADPQKEHLHLVLVWSAHEPERIGESCPLPRSCTLGRGSRSPTEDRARLELFRSRPGEQVPTGFLTAPKLSRQQWRLVATDAAVTIENVGKSSLVHNGVRTKSCRAVAGDTVGVEDVMLMLVTQRPKLISPLPTTSFAFGAADRHGIVGETPEAWHLRRELLRLATGSAHVLIIGASGTGKELCAQAIHRASLRSKAPLVARNAATIPASLLEAELFGQIAGYPNAGSPSRKGLVGAADKGCLLLDEVTELDSAQQANLLRVLDSGEYQRLGEDQMRRSDLRCIAVTNRALDAMKPDVLARFPERVSVPDLNARRADIPLLMRIILARLAEEAGRANYECSQELTQALVRHRYQHNFRELERLLRLACRTSASERLLLTSAVRAELVLPAEGEPDSERIRAALLHSKNVSEAAIALGLPSRFALRRLMKRLGMAASEPDALEADEN